MVDLVLFNFNDISVMFYGVLSLVLAILVYRRPAGRIKKHFKIFLSLFFFLGTLNAIDTILYWSVNINTTISALSPNFFFLGGFVFFLQGPLLYGFTKAAIYRHYEINKKYFWHLLPAFLCPLYMYMIYFRFDANYKLQYVHDWSLVIANPYFEVLIWSQRIAVFCYSVICTNILYQYTRHLKNIKFQLNNIDIHWLNVLIIGFLWINLWVVVELFISKFTAFNVGSIMGIMESYFRCIYVCALVIYLLHHSRGFAEIQLEHTFSETPVLEEGDSQQQIIEKLQAYMDLNKPYLELHLNVERLAGMLDVTPKALSSAINMQLKMNFFEVTSFYRIEESKRQLADVNLRELSINDVMKNCGFNSKSVFNQAFKKSTGVTPSYYRQQHLG